MSLADRTLLQIPDFSVLKKVKQRMPEEKTQVGRLWLKSNASGRFLP